MYLANSSLGRKKKLERQRTRAEEKKEHMEIRRTFTVHEIDSQGSDSNPYEEYVDKVWKHYDTQGNHLISKAKSA